eukprot:CAMPEP_0202687382 /NCGR_PEP_ID=MMETSP1385-20130828/3078_1 /ASSEMBLY_ACC=CAM_ASM_000861 /TAXON_ID=933848 /ORGANISM="Elphidium margaritaceum" /LENGTH=217 /DNA_ID=CAMNT_0049342165 /DNA_START=18 /DNA_END=671 /DNA_ORIENTATION=+
MALQSIFRIKVTNAGLLDLNGNYDVCNSLAKFPTIESIEPTVSNHHRHKPQFMYVHLSQKKWEYAIYLQPLPEMGYEKQKQIWVLARINIGANNKSSPIILYFAPRLNNDNIPPPNGWLPCGGIDPAPQCEIIQLQLPKKGTPSPLRKAIAEANKDETKLTEMMFDLGGQKADPKLSHLEKDKMNKGAKVAKLMNNPRQHINQPGAKSKDIRRVRGE